MKRSILTFVLATAAGLGLSSLLAKRADAYPGGYCINASGCARCEVCLKESATASSGKCVKVQGCN